jgi:hypothetical protein
MPFSADYFFFSIIPDPFLSGPNKNNGGLKTAINGSRTGGGFHF